MSIGRIHQGTARDVFIADHVLMVLTSVLASISMERRENIAERKGKIKSVPHHIHTFQNLQCWGMWSKPCSEVARSDHRTWFQQKCEPRLLNRIATNRMLLDRVRAVERELGRIPYVRVGGAKQSSDHH